MGMSAPAGAGVKSDINITPLVDVMLVLLIIFMVVTPMLQDGVDVQMAQTQKPPEKAKAQDDSQVMISLKYSGAPECAEVWFKDEWQPYDRPERCEGLGSLESKLIELRERRPGTEILIKADRRINFGSVKRVMKTCNTKGFEAVALIVQRDVSSEAS